MKAQGLKSLSLKQCTVLLAAGFCASFATFGDVSASTVFDITGNSTYSGTLTVDTVAGDLSAANVMVVTPPDYTNILQTGQVGSEFHLSISNTTTSPGPILTLFFDDGGTLVGFTGGTIDTSIFLGLCDLSSLLCRGVPQTLGVAALSPETAAAPLPAALPLFATGLGGLGLLGWRRKRKSRAAVA